ncbi:unnamed protein product [Clavelina lepadiformis]|uniref:Uncharacterized protein n=1 Tax=Clavelina lepadiformis TaxID=159417 RepID=A0ABP0GF77_CLALP
MPAENEVTFNPPGTSYMGAASVRMKRSICHFLLALFKERSLTDDQPMMLFAEVEGIINGITSIDREQINRRQLVVIN